MLLLALAAAAATAAAPHSPGRPPAERAQARASVRIVAGRHIRFAEIEAEQPRALRSTTLRSPDGDARPARLLEFE